MYFLKAMKHLSCKVRSLAMVLPSQAQRARISVITQFLSDSLDLRARDSRRFSSSVCLSDIIVLHRRRSFSIEVLESTVKFLFDLRNSYIVSDLNPMIRESKRL